MKILQLSYFVRGAKNKKSGKQKRKNSKKEKFGAKIKHFKTKI